MFCSFLEFAPSNFLVDQPQKISSSVMELEGLSKLLVRLVFFKQSC